MVHSTIIVGAGVAGLSAAAVLRGAGRDVLVLEKSRGLGGRAATRRWEEMPVDHGAQFFTARSDDFRGQVADWLRRDVCHEWTCGFHQFRGGKLAPSDDGNHPRYACREGMSVLGRAMARVHGIRVELLSRINAVVCAKGLWSLQTEDGHAYSARSLIVTCPPPQGAELLSESCHDASELLRGIVMEPCLAVAAAFPRRDLPWRGIQADDQAVSWIGNDTSKRPELHGRRTVVVVHASPAFSREFYTARDRDIVADMLRRASEISGEEFESPEIAFLQRWRYAAPSVVPDENAASAATFNLPAPLVLAGESFAGGKIEGAWRSGRAGAESLLRS